MPLAAAPDGPVDIPPVVARLAAGERITSVWRNELGGLTFRLGEDRYVKWITSDRAEIELTAEAERLSWAGQFTSVPEVLEVGGDDGGANDGSDGMGADNPAQWLVTRALAGESAVSQRWVAEPAHAAEAIGRGLRSLHDALPVIECPYTWTTTARIERFEARAARGMTPADWSTDHRSLTIDSVRDLLHDQPPVDGPVVCHGDACAPNTILGDDGTVVGHVDLGSLGVADRWADLAIAAWSTVWNYGPGFEGAVYRGYGITPDRERIRYYRLLWDVT